MVRYTNTLVLYTYHGELSAELATSLTQRAETQTQTTSVARRTAKTSGAKEQTKRQEGYAPPAIVVSDHVYNVAIAFVALRPLREGRICPGR